VSTAPPARVQPVPLTTSSTLLTLLTVALWGGNPVATLYSTDALPPVTVAGLRFLLATGVMLVWCLAERTSFRVSRQQVAPILIAGSLLFLQITVFTIGTAWTSSSHASLFVNTFVFWVVGLEHFVTRTDRLTSLRWSGLALAALGVLALLWEGEAPAGQRDEPSLVGDVLLLISAFLLGVKFIYTKQALKVIGPTELIFWHDIVAVVQFAVAAALLERPDFRQVSTPAWLGLIYQGVLVGGVCFALQAHLLKRHSASQIAVFSFLTPIFGIFIGMWLRGDQLSVWLVLSGLTVAAGIYLVNRRE
jgi:drug/metabolite transporter (DMT)-like permease